MFLRLFLHICLLFFTLQAQEYPEIFKTLGTPLYQVIPKINSFSDVEALKGSVTSFKNEASICLNNGKSIDKLQDKKAIKLHLKELRKLQKSYDYIIHAIHKEIAKSIKKNDYKLFCKLTKYELSGLLENKNIQNQAIDFYTKNAHKKTNKLLVKKIGANELLENSTQEMYNEIIQSTYNSNSKTNKKKSVGIVASRDKNIITISLYNKNSYDVTMQAIPQYKNMKQLDKVEKEVVIKANTSIKYMRLKVLGSGAYYSYSFYWMMGSKNANHNNNYVYRLPFAKNSSFAVSQGFNGTKTHKGSSQYSIDFAMPIGTKVYSARGGVVVKTKSNSNIGGYDKKFASSGNFVRVLHDDGTFGTYYHLKQRGVLVKQGQVIPRGFAIGYSGNTGYSSGPHLHFSVFKSISARKIHTIKIKFSSVRGMIEEPLNGEYYKAK